MSFSFMTTCTSDNRFTVLNTFLWCSHRRLSHDAVRVTELALALACTARNTFVLAYIAI